MSHKESLLPYATPTLISPYDSAVWPPAAFLLIPWVLANGIVILTPDLGHSPDLPIISFVFPLLVNIGVAIFCWRSPPQAPKSRRVFFAIMRVLASVMLAAMLLAAFGKYYYSDHPLTIGF